MPLHKRKTHLCRNITGYEPYQRIYRQVQQRSLQTIPQVVLQHTSDNYVAHKLPSLLVEHEYKLGTVNKVFAAEWLSDQQVVLGTKCNKIMILDLVTRQIAVIPSLKSSNDSVPADCPCGIHAISVNPSRTLLATGAEHTNDLGIYRLPSFDPLCVAEGGHADWIFDMKWLDDEFIVTGSRDNNLALWQITDDDSLDAEQNSHTKRIHENLHFPDYTIRKPITVKTCGQADKIRALSFNSDAQELAALSLNAQLHLWDVRLMEHTRSIPLHYIRENVCLKYCESRKVYAIGSQSHITLVDSRKGKPVSTITSPERGCGIRSLCFRDDVVSIGTGDGSMFFYDLRAERYLLMECEHPFDLRMSKGWLLHDGNYHNYFMNQEHSNAIYSHSYDKSGAKLLTVGGPLPAGLHGNYCAVWQ